MNSSDVLITFQTAESQQSTIQFWWALLQASVPDPKHHLEVTHEHSITRNVLPSSNETATHSSCKQRFWLCNIDNGTITFTFHSRAQSSLPCDLGSSHLMYRVRSYCSRRWMPTPTSSAAVNLGNIDAACLGFESACVGAWAGLCAAVHMQPRIIQPLCQKQEYSPIRCG